MFRAEACHTQLLCLEVTVIIKYVLNFFKNAANYNFSLEIKKNFFQSEQKSRVSAYF